MRASNTGSDSGYSTGFSWWRKSFHNHGYTVINLTEFCGTTFLFDAVMDDFGNLVKAGK